MTTQLADGAKDLDQNEIYDVVFGGEGRKGERDESPDIEELLAVLSRYADSADRRDLRVRVRISFVE